MCRKNDKITFQTCSPFFRGSFKKSIEVHPNTERSDFAGGLGGGSPPVNAGGVRGGRQPPPDGPCKKVGK